VSGCQSCLGVVCGEVVVEELGELGTARASPMTSRIWVHDPPR
jgi:hypothetical protein